MVALTLPSPAKLNLFLHITGQRADGYHLLQTVFQLLDYSDEIMITLREDPQIHCNDLPGVAGEKNLVVRAAKLLQQLSGTRQGANIQITKHLPMGGGLGGGSSNAATTLVALNHLWQLNWSLTELCQIGLQLGADVPVFIMGKSAWAEGIGERLIPLSLAPKWFLVLIPNTTVSTQEIFLNSQLTRDTSPITICEFFEGNKTLKNDCEPLVRQKYPSIDAALSWLEQFAPSKLTGTGCCIFAVFEKKTQALAVNEKIKYPWQSFVTQGINESPLLNFFNSHTMK